MLGLGIALIVGLIVQEIPSDVLTAIYLGLLAGLRIWAWLFPGGLWGGFFEVPLK